MLIRDKEQLRYIRSAMIRDVSRCESQITAIEAGNVTAIDTVQSVAELNRRVELALEIDSQIAKTLTEMESVNICTEHGWHVDGHGPV